MRSGHVSAPANDSHVEKSHVYKSLIFQKRIEMRIFMLTTDSKCTKLLQGRTKYESPLGWEATST